MSGFLYNRLKKPRTNPERENTANKREIMPEPKENEVVDDTTIQDGTEETTTDDTTEGEVDYDTEFTQAVEKFETAEKNREGFAKRKSTDEEADETVKTMDIEEQVAAAIRKALPKLQSSLVEDNVESALDDLSGGNDAKKKLIRFHFENSVGTNGTIRERMENALLIADKKSILKTQKELAVALKNRQGLSSTGQGSSTDGMQVKDNFFAADQLAELKAKGWDDAKIQRLKDNLQKSR